MAFKSVPCGKCLFLQSKQHIAKAFYSFVGIAVRHLCKQYGKSNVLYENSYVDLTLNEPTGCTFFEIKMEWTVKRCIRSALGQLLEYAHYPTGSRAKRLVVVGDVLPTDDDRRYVSLLREKYQIPIYYRRFRWETNELEGEI